MSLVKILTVGDGQVGKTTLMKILSDERIDENEIGIKRTIIFDFHLMKYPDSCQSVFFDIAGQETEGMDIAISGMSRFVLGGVNLILFMFDVNRMESLLSISRWYSTINQLYKEKDMVQPKIIIIGNKCDLVSTISIEMINKLIDSNEDFIKYMETSCINGHGVSEVKEMLHHFIHEGSL